MKKFIFILILFGVFTVGAAAQTKPSAPAAIIPADYASDGCSRFPDGDYVDCCYEHDKSYFIGGSWKMRWRADKKLYKCVAAKNGVEHKFIAPVMWAGVRLFGAPFLPTPFRWGFGKTAVSKPNGK